MVEEVSTVVGAACAPAAAEVSAGGRILHPLPGIGVRALLRLPLHAQEASTERGWATAFPGPAVILRAEVSVMEILFQHPLLSLTANGIPSAAHPEAEDQRVSQRKPGHQVTPGDSMCLAGIAALRLPVQYAASLARAAKSGRTLPPREMLCPGLSLFPRFTIRSADRPLRVQRSGRILHSLRHRALRADRRSRAIENFLAA